MRANTTRPLTQHQPDQCACMKRPAIAICRNFQPRARRQALPPPRVVDKSTPPSRLRVLLHSRCWRSRFTYRKSKKEKIAQPSPSRRSTISAYLRRLNIAATVDDGTFVEDSRPRNLWRWSLAVPQGLLANIGHGDYIITTRIRRFGCRWRILIR